MTGYTPSLWERIGTSVFTVTEPKQEVVHKACGKTRDEQEANAALIAEAPAMRMALEWATEVLSQLFLTRDINILLDQPASLMNYCLDLQKKIPLTDRRFLEEKTAPIVLLNENPLSFPGKLNAMPGIPMTQEEMKTQCQTVSEVLDEGERIEIIIRHPSELIGFKQKYSLSKKQENKLDAITYPKSGLPEGDWELGYSVKVSVVGNQVISIKPYAF